MKVFRSSSYFLSVVKTLHVVLVDVELGEDVLSNCNTCGSDFFRFLLSPSDFLSFPVSF